LLFVCYGSTASKVVRASFVMPPDGIEDRVAQAMAAIGFTIEPHSQIVNSFTFRAAGARLVVTKTSSGIEVAGRRPHHQPRQLLLPRS
jgi:hypothetical protein